MRLLSFVLSLAAVGCLGTSPGSGSSSADADADADTDADADVGDGDTDGDGWSDAEEAASYTDPDDAEDHPYEFGDYPMDPCRNDIESTGYTPGDIAPDFVMPDQFGQPVRLHDFCDHTVVMTIGAFWCGPCIEAAAELRAMYDELGDEGFWPLDITAWNRDGAAATVPDLAAWAEDYDLNTPVLWDDTFRGTSDYMAQGNGLPHRVILAPGMEVVTIGVYSEEEIRDMVLEIAAR